MTVMGNRWYGTSYIVAVAAVLLWLVIDRRNLTWPPTSIEAAVVLVLDAVCVFCFAMGWRRDHEKE